MFLPQAFGTCKIGKCRREIIKKIYASILRIALALAAILGLPAAVYCLWQPGSCKELPVYPDNAIWIGHGWFGDDAWFIRNQRNPGAFRPEEKITALFEKLRENHVSIVFPHLCPAQYDGRIAPHDDRHRICGIAIYCEWEMNAEKWQIWRKFIRQ